MTVYHYELQVDLTTLEWEEQTIWHNFGVTEAITLHFDTTTRLVKDEFLTITTVDRGLVNLKITKIERYGLQVTADNELIEKDMSNPWHQENRPNCTSDEVWFTCKASAFVITLS